MAKKNVLIGFANPSCTMMVCWSDYVSAVRRFEENVARIAVIFPPSSHQLIDGGFPVVVFSQDTSRPTTEERKMMWLDIKLFRSGAGDVPVYYTGTLIACLVAMTLRQMCDWNAKMTRPSKGVVLSPNRLSIFRRPDCNGTRTTSQLPWPPLQMQWSLSA